MTGPIKTYFTITFRIVRIAKKGGDWVGIEYIEATGLSLQLNSLKVEPSSSLEAWMEYPTSRPTTFSQACPASSWRRETRRTPRRFGSYPPPLPPQCSTHQGRSCHLIALHPIQLILLIRINWMSERILLLTTDNEIRSFVCVLVTAVATKCLERF